jgi:cation-transporting ATPase 13A3/4/5
MCGDGANDLMAIRESDVGIGLCNSDASYGATFSISNIIEIDEIIRDSKATTTNIVEMIRYYEFISFLKIPASLLMVLDSAYLNQAQLLFFNFTSTIIYPILQAISRPSKTVTRAIPNGNLFGLGNHFRFWGSIIIATCGLVGGYFYFRSTPNFKPTVHNIVEKSWFPATFTATCMFLLVLSPFTIYSLFFYIG